MTAYTFRMPGGIPGDINRAQSATVEPQVITPVGTTGAPPAYGVGVVADLTAGNVGNMRIPAAGDALLYGILARPFPTASSQDGLGTSTPPAKGLCDVMKRGYMTVLLSGATAPKKGGAVYCRIQNAGAGQFVGGFEAAADGGNTIQVGTAFTCYFTGPADAAGNVEIAFNV
jgi:hypothetical protein